MADQRHIESDDPEAARREIERIRNRMSGTLDEIEDNLLQKKEQIRDALDFRAHLRKKPLHFAGAVLATGVILGFLSAGGRREARVRKKYGERALRWEKRARRLLAIAREQESEIDRLEELPAFLAPATGAPLAHPDPDDAPVDEFEYEDYANDEPEDEADEDWDDDGDEDGDEDGDDDGDPWDEDDDEFELAYKGTGRWGPRFARIQPADREASALGAGVAALRRAVTDRIAQFAAETAHSLREEVKKRR